MGYFSKSDKEQIDKALDETNAIKNKEQKMAEEIKSALLYTLDCYLEAVSELPSLGLNNVRIYTALPCRKTTNIFIDSPYFLVDTKGKFYTEKIKKISIKKVRITVQDIINSCYYNLSFDSAKICVPAELERLSMLSCEIKYHCYIDILSKEETKERVKKHILEEIKKAMYHL